MKLMKTALLVCSMFVSVAAFGQGQINFANRITGTVDAPIRDVGGALATGANGFFAQLYVGAPGDSLEAVGAPVALRSDGGIGYVVASIVSTPLPGATLASVKMVAWSGAATYASALTTIGAKVGESAPITVTLGNPLSSPPGTPVALAGLQGFTVTTVVPEPSTIALAAVGAGLLLFRRKTA